MYAKNCVSCATFLVKIKLCNSALDGLLYHESDLEIREHYTDTAGFTDHVFALMHLLGFAFCPRMMWSNNQDTKLTSKMEVFSEPETKIYP